ncbi:hypothetical protein MXB_519 [Myxobolus squamalis]|nr:hypothetical protein MXB_519 [Myxobolus squamalis]
MPIVILFSAIIIPQIVFLSNEDGQILVQAHVIFRHGLRSPLWLYANTPCPSSVYYDGLGEIMNDGLRTSYSLGQTLKKRYIDSNESKLLSDTSERCIQSAMAVTGGLFPPRSTKREWLQNLNWYPIPIRSGGEEVDMVGIVT